MKIKRLRNFQNLIAVVYVILAITVVFCLFSDRVYDDPFITYRYAANLSTGMGFVYNAGEHVLSTTTPLFTLLLAGIAWLAGNTSHLPFIANLIGAISLGVTGLLLWKLGQEWKSPWAGWTGLLLYPIFPLTVITLGSETPLYIFLCIAAIYLYVREQYTATAILGALAVLTRPDGILITFLLACHYLVVVRKTIPWKAVLAFIALTGVWVLFAWSYFDSPLPVTLLAKQQQVNIANTEKFAPGFITILEWFNEWPYWIALALAVLGFVVLLWKERSWLMVIGWTVIYFAGYSLLGVSRYFWYYAPLVPGFLALLGLGISTVYRLLVNVFQKYRTGKTTIQILLTSTLLVFFIVAQGTSLWNLSQQPDQRSGLYIKVGKWLAENTLSDSSIGTLETGIIGFYAQRNMIDFAGLLYPDVAKSMTVGSTYEDAARFVFAEYQPEILVLQRGLFPRLEADLTEHNCQIKATFQEDVNPYAIDIYCCE